MALPIINAADESITDLLLQNNSLLTEVVSRLDEQVNVAKNVAEQERIRIENEQYSAVEAASEMGDSGGMLGRGMASAYTGAQAELGNLKGLFPFGGIGAVVGGGILASLIYMFRDSITEFLQENAADALEMLGVGEDLTGKVTEFLSNAAGVGIGASIGKIFGFRGALLGGLLGYIVSDYGIGRLFDEDSENDQAVYNNFFDTLKTDPSKVGLELGGLLALLGKWRAGLLIGIGSFVFEKMDLSRLFTEEGRADIMKGVEDEFNKITDRDLGISDAIGVLMGTFLGSKLISGVRNGFASLFVRRTPSTTAAPNQAEIDERLTRRTNQVRSQAAQEVLQSVDDAELERAGLRKVAGGGVQRITGGYASADQLAGAVDRFGLGEQFKTAQFNRISAPPVSASRKVLIVLGKLAKRANWFVAAGINIYAIYAVWADEQMSDEEKMKQTGYYLAGLATGALGALAGSIVGAAAGTAIFPVVGTAVGGFIGMGAGGALGFFAGETLVKIIVEWLTSESDQATLPMPDAATEQEARAQMNVTALDNIIGMPAGMNIAEPVDTPLSVSNNSTLSQKQAELQGLNMRLTSRVSGQQRRGLERRRDALVEEIRNLENSGARIEDTSAATDVQSRIGGSVGTNEVSGLTSNLRESSVIVASSPVTNIFNNNTTNNTSGGGGRSGNVPAGRSYNIDQSFNGVQRPAYA